MASVAGIVGGYTWTLAKKGASSLVLSYNRKKGYYTLRQANQPINYAKPITAAQAASVASSYKIKLPSLKSPVPSTSAGTRVSASNVRPQAQTTRAAYERATRPATLGLGQQWRRQRPTDSKAWSTPGIKIVNPSRRANNVNPDHVRRLATPKKKMTTTTQSSASTSTWRPDMPTGSNPILRRGMSSKKKVVLAGTAAVVAAATLRGLSSDNKTATPKSAAAKTSVRDNATKVTKTSLSKPRLTKAPMEAWQKVVSVYGGAIPGIKNKTDFSPKARQIAMNMLKMGKRRSEKASGATKRQETRAKAWG